MEQYHGTTILCVRRGNRVAMGGDGQVTLGNIVIKASARKVRRIYNGRILAGFAGGTADAFTLFERFEAKLDKHQGNLLRCAVELAKDWRSDRALRRLEAMLAVADRENSLIVTGNGDVVEPEHGIVAIGSGGAERNTQAKVSGASSPNNDGPSRMPTMISPTAADCRSLRANAPPTRPASTMTVSWSNVKNSSASALWTATCDVVVMQGHH